MGYLFQELIRRKVFRVACYAMVAWPLTQTFDVELFTFGAPIRGNQTIIYTLLIGFPLALILAWVFELLADRNKETLYSEAILPTEIAVVPLWPRANRYAVTRAGVA